MPKWLKTLLAVVSVVLNLLGGTGVIPPVVGAPNALVK